MSNLTELEQKIIIDFMECAIGEGHRGGGQFKDIDLKKTIIGIGVKLGLSYEDAENMFK